MYLSISVGVMAYNEEKNIGKLLELLLTQKLKSCKLKEIIVISSGSNDNTNEIVNKKIEKSKLIKLYTQKTRLGKASAVNLFLKKASSPLVITMSADLLLKKDTLENLIAPFKNPEVGITGAHPVPLNDHSSFMGYAAHFLWGLHHNISKDSPKMGEMIAFRKIFKQIPYSSSVDEANIEPLIRGQGYKAEYMPSAIVYNKGPEKVSEFIARRRHIYYGHLITRHKYGYEVSTYNPIKIVYYIFKKPELSIRFFAYTPLILLLESYGRLLGYMDFRFKIKTHTIWETTPSTKKLR